MVREEQLILDRYRPLSKAGSGGFGTVQVAWDTRIQRKVAIKCIQLSEIDAARAALPGANAVSRPEAAQRPPRVQPTPKVALDLPELSAVAVMLPWETEEEYHARAARATKSRPWAVGSLAGDDGRGFEPDDSMAFAETEEYVYDANGEVIADSWAETVARSRNGSGRETRGGSPDNARNGNSDDARGGFDSDGVRADEPLVRSLAHLPGLDEARTAATLTDTNIVQVYDFEVRGSTAYLIMEYVEGLTLTQLLARYDDQLTLDMITAVFSSIAHALEVAHSNQVLHLDIKPDNVLINKKGQVKVTDFGLATLADASGYGAAGGGTIGYMPLEQMRQENLDERCDEWALASVAYWMLVGKNPFLARDLHGAEAAIEDAELVLPSLCWDDLDAEADEVVFCALDPEREERFDSVEAFAQALEPFLGDAKEGTRDLSALVTTALEGEEEDDTADERLPRGPYIPLRYRITHWHRAVVARVLAAAGSALISSVGLALIPLTAGIMNPLFWGFFIACGLLGALKPHLGVLASFGLLGVGLIAHGAPALGIVLLLATAAWWYAVGRADDAAANTAFAAPFGGWAHIAPLAPLTAGFCLPPLAALATAGFALVTTLCLASLTGVPGAAQPLAWWNPLPVWEGLAAPDLQANAGAVITQPGFWCGAVGWLASAVVLAVVRLRPTRAFAVFGTLVATAVLGFAAAGSAWLGSGGIAASLGPLDWVAVLVPAGLMLLACVFVPEPLYYDEEAYSDGNYPYADNFDEDEG